MILAQHGLMADQLMNVIDVSYLADAVVVVRYFESNAVVKLAISVVKNRSGNHEKSVRELSLDGSITIGKPVPGGRGRNVLACNNTVVFDFLPEVVGYAPDDVLMTLIAHELAHACLSAIAWPRKPYAAPRGASGSAPLGFLGTDEGRRASNVA